MLKQVNRFLIVGTITTSFNYALFYLLILLNINYVFSSAFGYCAGIVMSYILNKKWAFNYQANHSITLIISYTVLYTITLLINLSVLALAVEILHINVLIANIIAIAVSTVLNFIGLKLIIFKNN